MNAAIPGLAEMPHPSRVPVLSLTQRKDFDALFSNGRRRRTGDVTVVRGPGLAGVTRIAVVAGRRVGGAVRRNRAKRRLRAILRSLSLPPGEDVVVIAGASTPDVEISRLTAWVRSGLGEET